MRRVTALILTILCAIPIAASARSIAGVGARPLSPTVAATYFIDTVVPLHSIELIAVVFLVSEPAWTSQKTDWTFGLEDPAYSSFVFPNASLRFELSVADGRLQILGRTVDTATSNVLVVSNALTPQARLSYSTHTDLSFAYESEPVIELVRRSKALRQALGLE